jgi:hypothetical protein
VDEELQPIVGKWYKREDDGEVFIVVSVDEDEGVIEIRPLDGEIEEIDEAAWEDMDIQLVDDPEELEATVELDEDEDLDYDEDDDEDEDDDDDDDWGDEFDDRE